MANFDTSKFIDANFTVDEIQDEEFALATNEEEFNIMSLTAYKKEKDALAERRKQVTLRLDGQKLKQAEKVISLMDMALDKIAETLVDGTAVDFNFLAQGYEKLNRQLQLLCRLDTVDGTGKAARLALQVNFSSGTSVTAAVIDE